VTAMSDDEAMFTPIDFAAPNLHLGYLGNLSAWLDAPKKIGDQP
jgi:hypothetical protein